MSVPPHQRFHGGKPGMQPGDLVLPPTETGQRTLGRVLAQHDAVCERCIRLGVTKVPQPRDPRLDGFVFFGTLFHATRNAACRWSIIPWLEGQGAVYEVEPLGHVQRYTAIDGAWMCRSARVVRVAQAAVAREMLVTLGEEPPDRAEFYYKHVHEFVQAWESRPRMTDEEIKREVRRRAAIWGIGGMPVALARYL